MKKALCRVINFAMVLRVGIASVTGGSREGWKVEHRSALKHRIGNLSMVRGSTWRIVLEVPLRHRQCVFMIFPGQHSCCNGIKLEILLSV